MSTKSKYTIDLLIDVQLPMHRVKIVEGLLIDILNSGVPFEQLHDALYYLLKKNTKTITTPMNEVNK